MSRFPSQFVADFQSLPMRAHGGSDAGTRMLLDRAALLALSDAQHPYAPLVLTNNRGYISRHRSGQPHTAATVKEFDDRTNGMSADSRSGGGNTRSRPVLIAAG
jgi:hypothetical protein